MSEIYNSYLIDLYHAGDFKASKKGDILTIFGKDNLKQALYHRLFTVKGSLQHRPEYGIGITTYLGALGNIDKKRALAMEIKKQFLSDSRVEKVDSISFEDRENGQFLLKFVVTGNGGQKIESELNPFGEMTL